MIALVGNPNCGKSALFNILTKSNQKIGNFPGITVDIEKRKYKEDIMVDLPGLYSLNYYTKDLFKIGFVNASWLKHLLFLN